jgi:hypothetical protein
VCADLTPVAASDLRSLNVRTERFFKFSISSQSLSAIEHNARLQGSCLTVPAGTVAAKPSKSLNLGMAFCFDRPKQSFHGNDGNPK